MQSYHSFHYQQVMLLFKRKSDCKIPFGQKGSRTLEVGCIRRGPSAPFWFEQWGVSTAQTDTIWTTVTPLIKQLVRNFRGWNGVQLTSYLSSAQSIQCCLFGYCLLLWLKRFERANWRAKRRWITSWATVVTHECRMCWCKHRKPDSPLCIYTHPAWCFPLAQLCSTYHFQR